MTQTPSDPSVQPGQTPEPIPTEPDSDPGGLPDTEPEPAPESS
jgi:hypothetical protein